MLSDVLSAVVVNLVGLGLILGSLQGSRHTTDPHNQLLLVNLATAGMIVVLAGNAVFLLSGLRRVGQLRMELLGARPSPQPVAEFADTAASKTRFVAALNMTRFHRADCPAVLGKEAVAGTLAEQLAAGRSPCGLCVPVAAPVTMAVPS
jgi:hypothetical protein